METSIVGDYHNVRFVKRINGKWFCVLNNFVPDFEEAFIVSDNLVDWETTNIDANTYYIIPDIVYINGVYCLYTYMNDYDDDNPEEDEEEEGSDLSYAVMYSNDGINWYASNLNNLSDVSSLVANDGVICCIYSTGDGKKIAYSLDGINWNSITNESIRGEVIHYACYENGILHVVYGMGEIKCEHINVSISTV